MKQIKTTLLLLAISLLSFSGFSQTQEFTDEASFLAALDDVTPTLETYDECSGLFGSPYPGGDFTISHSSGTGYCVTNLCSRGDGLSYYWGSPVKLTFSSPKNAFGTFIYNTGTAGPITVTLMTDDGQSYTAVMSAGGDITCNERFFGIISDMDFIMAEFTSNDFSDSIFLDDTYCANTLRPIPTLSQWGIIALSMIMLILGLVFVRQRKVILG